MSIESQTEKMTQQMQGTEIQQQTNSNLLRNISSSLKIKDFLDNFCTNEEIKIELARELDRYPLMCKLINESFSENQKRTSLEEALQKQQEASEHMDKDRLNEIAKTMGKQVIKLSKDNPKVSNFLKRNSNDITTSDEKMEILQTIVQKFSEVFGVKPPKLYTDGINISWLGISSFIKINWNEMSIWQLMHEYTHYLQTQWKTSDRKYTKQSRDYYTLPMYSGELLELTNKIYDNSLMELEAEYIRKVAQEQIYQAI